MRTLARELRSAIEGEVRFDNGSRALYATDASNYRQVPIGVVLPKSQKDIIQTVALCRKHDIPILSRGGGTSLAGQCCNEAVIMDMSKYYNRILNMDPQNRLVTVQTGIVLDHLRKATEEAAGLTFGPDPATHDHCTIGGMLGNNSCGVHSVMAQFYGYGPRTSDNTHSLKILTYDGTVMEVGPTKEKELDETIRKGGRKGSIYKALKEIRDTSADEIRKKFPDIPRRVSGFNLDELLPENDFNVARALVGTESTCAVILEATLQLIESPGKRSLLVLGYPDIYTAGNHCSEIMEAKPVGLEGLDDKLIGYMRKKNLNTEDLPLLPEGNGWLLVEFGGDTKEEADDKAHQLMEKLKKERNAPNMNLFDDAKQESMLWEIRESGLGATAHIPGMSSTWPGWEDSAVHPEKVGAYLKDLRGLFDSFGYDASLYGHFGQGCIHCRINFDFSTKEGIETYTRFTSEATDLVLKYGGSISGEHGDGQARGDLLEKMFGKKLMGAFYDFKNAWDPDWKMNPGKVIQPYGRTENLRIGTGYQSTAVATHFKFPEDHGSFAEATLRCVGVGKCRRSEGGTMCPSYMATSEESDSTRGRARLLFEMLQGEAIQGGWKEKSVKDALDLCLACKGCKGDCPVNVDMATYKSEFLSHYYKGRLRPRTAYVFGWIYWWSRIASKIPRFANFMTRTRGISDLIKYVGGVAPQRKIPQFALQTFKKWFSMQKRTPAPQKVILWADTFNNYYMPPTLKAAYDVLTRAGFEVIVPEQSLCCGRPLFDFGWIRLAKKLLLQILDTLKDEIREGIPVVGIEPSCAAVFRDELCNLFPENTDAQRLKSQVYTLGEFLDKYAPDFDIPVLERKAVMHGHCQHKAVMSIDKEEKILKGMGLDLKVLDSGCCGMAGYFGYEKGEHYRISLKAGERVLLPEVRKAEKDTLIIADGFSCREQIMQETDRQPLHLAEVIQRAMNQTNR